MQEKSSTLVSVRQQRLSLLFRSLRIHVFEWNGNMRLMSTPIVKPPRNERLEGRSKQYFLMMYYRKDRSSICLWFSFSNFSFTFLHFLIMLYYVWEFHVPFIPCQWHLWSVLPEFFCRLLSLDLKILTDLELSFPNLHIFAINTKQPSNFTRSGCLSFPH